VFDRFYQTDKTKDGAELGLSIAKAIYEQNSWKINCSEEGWGDEVYGGAKKKIKPLK
jgi:hypothetical protein